MIFRIEPGGRYRPAESILARNIGDEILIVRTHERGAAEEGAGFCLDGVGKLIRLLLDGEHTVQQVIDQVVEEFEASEEQVAADVFAFLDQLASEGIISD